MTNTAAPPPETMVQGHPRPRTILAVTSLALLVVSPAGGLVAWLWLPKGRPAGGPAATGLPDRVAVSAVTAS